MPNCAEEIVAPVVGETNLFMHSCCMIRPATLMPTAGTENGQQTGQPGDHENLQLLKIARQKLARRQIDHAYKQRAAGQDKQQSQENYGRTIRSDTILPLLQYG
ncbi:MAG: hypothetical protein ACLVD8_26425 [Enterocloster sp.]|uniref:hypothetical protein n=1 Tax=Enterocloster sp. TaxID=2719315 RepID=UPI00399A7081